MAILYFRFLQVLGPLSRRSAMLFALCACVLGGIGPASAGDDLVLVSGADHGVASLSAKEAKKYLTGQVAKWPDGQLVVIVLLPAQDGISVRACAEIIRMPGKTYRRFLTEKSFRGGMTPPIEVESTAVALAKLTEQPGALIALPRAAVISGTVIEIGEK